ncbi:relaxase domain-containing protein (plasmid) [Streptomyces californicus]|uniref:Relaxase domain-containing protein n=1 Tax=Streptomyces californicus TaxID=67351 RepID=A0ABD7DC46_9ACTN|nr:MobF family relaxase [Streptomyces californicus]QRV39218.1 relaxase domain-containing protein [Streptomyces californicus]QRV52670.1 relaxase domain-containing protein [Streptomyces californicus]
MLSVAKVQRRNAWRYYVRGVAYGDGLRPVGQSLKAAQEEAGLPPGRWRGRGLAALGLNEGSEVSERHMELAFGQGRHPDADRIEQHLLDDGAAPDTARRATVLGQPIEEIEGRKQTPLLALDFTFRPQASLTVLWALGDAHTRRVIEGAHERAVTQALRWLEDEVAETRWSSGRGRAKTPALVVAAFRHFDNRDGFPLLHEHCLVLNRVQRRGADGEPRWGALDTTRLYKHVVAAGTLYTLTMTTEVCEELGLATVPREVTPGLRPVMEIAGVDQVLIDWSSTRRQRIEDVLEGLTYTYAQQHGRLPGEKARHGLGWQAAQDTRPEKKTPRPLEQLLTRWRASALAKVGKQMLDGLLHRCRAVGAAIRARVDPHVDVTLAAVDVAAVVFTVRRTFARRHVLAEARRHLLETLRGRAFAPGLDDHITDRALEDHTHRTTGIQPGRRAPAPGQIFYTADFPEPDRWWIAGTDGKPPRESSRYERARIASLAVRNAIRSAHTKAAARTDDHHGPASAPPHAVDHPGRGTLLTPAQRAAAVHAHQQAAMPEEHLEGRTTDPGTWLRTPENLDRLAAFTRAADARRRTYEDTESPAAPDAPAADRHHQEHEQQRQPGHGQDPGPRP